MFFWFGILANRSLICQIILATYLPRGGCTYLINCDLETVGFPGAIMHKLHLASGKARLAPKHVSQNEDNSGDEKISWSYYQTATPPATDRKWATDLAGKPGKIIQALAFIRNKPGLQCCDSLSIPSASQPVLFQESCFRSEERDLPI